MKNILEGVVNRSSKVINYREKLEEKTRKRALAQASRLGLGQQKTAAYPSVRKWFVITKEESNETAGMDVSDGAECGKPHPGENLKSGSNLQSNLGIKKIFPNSTQCKANSNGKGRKRKTEDLDFSSKTDDTKRRKVGPMDRHVIKKVKLGLNLKMTTETGTEGISESI